MKKYLGDAVYADFDGWNIILTTEDGIQSTNLIVLEPEVAKRVVDFVRDLMEDRS